MKPIASLAPHKATRVMAALHAINREYSITVICNLHALNTARTFCDRLIGMARGKLVFDGPPTALTTAMLQEIYGRDEGAREVHASAEVADMRLQANRDEELIRTAR
jgi:phosphonate transport system ATP-binding protein